MIIKVGYKGEPRLDLQEWNRICMRLFGEVPTYMKAKLTKKQLLQLGFDSAARELYW